MASSAIKTRKVTDRRELRFGRMKDLLRDVEQLAAQGEVAASGNWTPGQIVDHVTTLVDWSIDGFPDVKLSWPLRVIGGFMKDRALNRPMSPGFKVPGGLRQAVPAPSITWDEAVSHLRRTIHRIDEGLRMEQPSPLLGPLGHEQWEQLHCRHAEMHFSFLKVGG